VRVNRYDAAALCYQRSKKETCILGIHMCCLCFSLRTMCGDVYVLIVIVLGGMTSSSLMKDKMVDSIDEYNPSLNTWSTLSWTLPLPLARFAAAYVNDSIIIGGGITADNQPNLRVYAMSIHRTSSPSSSPSLSPSPSSSSVEWSCIFYPHRELSTLPSAATTTLMIATGMDDIENEAG
jgi:hypothetical protein